ncbi:MAG: protein-glutamate O-methyltransferase CheR, partial [Polyangiaceae bacterium]|nr:protein-glutamate O-methyltransferase CheR [Polyangiaceae bacterium]
CSTGEEVYTLAISLIESGLTSGVRLSVIGSDLCRSRIEFAERGIYRDHSFRSTPARLKRKYFSPTPDGLAISEEVKRICHFRPINLLDPQEVRQVGRVDAIFCRNVLIYFADNSRHQVIEHFHERLIPGAHLFLGHSENLLTTPSPFESVSLEKDIAYRRAATHSPLERNHR